MNILDKVFARMWQTPGKTSGEAIAEETGGVNLVEGKQTWEQISEQKNDVATMKQCCESEIAT